MNIEQETNAILNADIDRLNVILAELRCLNAVAQAQAKRVIAESLVQQEPVKAQTKAKGKAKGKRSIVTQEKKDKARAMLLDGRSSQAVAIAINMPAQYVYNLKSAMKKNGELK